MPTRFHNLTQAQEDALGLLAMDVQPAASPKTLEALERAGLIVGEDRTLPGFPPVTVREYHVPIPVHMEWCAWCAENCPADLPEEESET